MAKRANGEGTKIVKVPNRKLYSARYTDASPLKIWRLLHTSWECG